MKRFGILLITFLSLVVGLFPPIFPTIFRKLIFTYLDYYTSKEKAEGMLGSGKGL